MGEEKKAKEVKDPKVPGWLRHVEYSSLSCEEKLVMELLTNKSITKEAAVKLLYLSEQSDC